MRIRLVVVSVFFIICTPVFSAERLFMMPQDSDAALGSLIYDIDQAETQIVGAIYSFTHRKISKALKNAAARGVHITLLMDAKSNINNRHSRIGDLAKIRNIDIRTISGLPAKKGNYSGKMHMKALVIDTKLVYFGSANWSNSAFGLNYESLFKTDSPAIVTIYRQSILDLFDLGKSYY